MEGTNLATDCNGPVEDAMHAQDSRLWWIDNRCAEHGAEHAAITDGERSSVHILHGQLVLAGLKKKKKKRIGVFYDECKKRKGDKKKQL